MTFVSASSASISAISPTPRSDSLPTDTSLANPSPRAAPREISVPIIVPLCDTTLAPPRGNTSLSNAALTVMIAPLSTLARPIEFGPITRTPSDLARSTSFFSRAAPSGPVSAKPSL